MEITGRITQVLKLEDGTSKAGREFKKLSFLVETDETYNNKYCFDLFQMNDNEEKKLIVDNFLKYNKENDHVTVSFNIKTSDEWNGKYFTNLSAWMVKKGEVTASPDLNSSDTEDDLPF